MEIREGAGFQDETLTDATMEPLSQPFKGSYYESHPHFPGRLLILGESAYLTDKDRESDFTVDLLGKVAKTGRTSGGRITYYRKLFFVLTNKHFRNASDEEWQSVWNSLAFYHFVQTPLRTPRERPSKTDWDRSKAPFMARLGELRPDFVLMTGKQLDGWIRTIEGVRTTGDRILTLPIDRDHLAAAVGIYHPSCYGYFKPEDARASFERLLKSK
jgi:hypothetical protein